MAFDFKYNCLAVSDVNDASSFPRTLQDAFAFDREFFQDRLGIFIAAML
ncbi:Uncharacterised protein [Mycobacteroides abscessus subsp. abscessus]|nr:Uncharacterised protein [Mycobacteroides abscessus subsp. abscessus]